MREAEQLPILFPTFGETFACLAGFFFDYSWPVWRFSPEAGCLKNQQQPWHRSPKYWGINRWYLCPWLWAPENQRLEPPNSVLCMSRWISFSFSRGYFQVNQPAVSWPGGCAYPLRPKDHEDILGFETFTRTKYTKPIVESPLESLIPRSFGVGKVALGRLYNVCIDIIIYHNIHQIYIIYIYTLHICEPPPQYAVWNEGFVQDLLKMKESWCWLASWEYP